MESMSLPLATFVLLTYNQERTIERALNAALAQSYSPLEILITDDASSDETQALISRITSNYTGPHTVVVNYNERNLGIVQHVNKAFAIARGEFVILAAGDDESTSDRVERIMGKWLSEGKRPSAIFSRIRAVDLDGNVQESMQPLVQRKRFTPRDLIKHVYSKDILVVGASGSYSPDVISRFGPLLAGGEIEDIPLTVRASMLSEVAFIDEELVTYSTGTSTYYPHKLRNEGFDRHLARLLFITRTQYQTARQILHDAILHGDPELVRIATERAITTTYLYQRSLDRKMKPFNLLQISLLTGFWREPWLTNLMLKFRWLHKILFSLSRLGRA